MGKSSAAKRNAAVELKEEFDTMINEEYELLKEVFKNLPDYVMFVGADGRIKFVNQNMARFAGVSNPDELVGKKPADISRVHPNFVDAAKRLISAIKNREKLEDLEMKFITRNGDEIHVSVSVYPVYINGDYIGCMEVFSDRITKILDSIQVPVFAIDSNHRVIQWNKACEIYTGVKAEEVIGTDRHWYAFYNEKRPTLADLIVDNPTGIHNQYTNVEVCADGAYRAETWVTLRNGKKVYFRASAAPIRDEYGRVTGVVETLEDRTEIQEVLEYTRNIVDMLSNGIRELSAGNLNVRLEKLRDDEFGKIFDVFNEFVERWSNMIRQLVKDMKETVEQLRQANDAVKQMNAGMEQISSASQQIATASENLSRLANSTMAEVRASEQIFKDLAASAKEADSFADTVSKDAKESKEEGAKALEMLNKILEEIEKVASMMNSLESTVREIGKVTERIKSIADQTNLLALNAAIEAARAGEYGRGFAVVADEIRKLAEESRRSTEEINEIIRSVQDETKKVIDATMSVKVDATDSGKEVESALTRATKIAETVDKISEMLKEISRKAEDGLTKIEQITKSFEEVASTAEENAASSEETSAAIEEQTAAIQQVSMNMENINNIANKTLEELIKNFKVFIDSLEN